LFFFFFFFKFFFVGGFFFLFFFCFLFGGLNRDPEILGGFALFLFRGTPWGPTFKTTGRAHLFFFFLERGFSPSGGGGGEREKKGAVLPLAFGRELKAFFFGGGPRPRETFGCCYQGGAPGNNKKNPARKVGNRCLLPDGISPKGGGPETPIFFFVPGC